MRTRKTKAKSKVVGTGCGKSVTEAGIDAMVREAAAGYEIRSAMRRYLDVA